MSATYPQGFKIQCSQCGQWWTVSPSNPERVCTCHLICPDGTKQTDCNVQIFNFTGETAWPLGLEHNSESRREKRYKAYGFCDIHNKYTYKYPTIVEVPANYFTTPLPVSQRYTRKPRRPGRYR